MNETKKQKKIEWNPRLSLSVWPEHIQEVFRKEAKSLYEDLKQNKQIVIVGEPWPGFDNKVRVVQSYAPIWYGRLYKTLGQSRKRTLEALLRIANAKDGEFKFDHHKYDSILRGFIFDCLMDGYKENAMGCLERDFIIFKNKKVKEYFTAK